MDKKIGRTWQFQLRGLAKLFSLTNIKLRIFGLQFLYHLKMSNGGDARLSKVTLFFVCFVLSYLQGLVLYSYYFVENLFVLL